MAELEEPRFRCTICGEPGVWQDTVAGALRCERHKPPDDRCSRPCLIPGEVYDEHGNLLFLGEWLPDGVDIASSGVEAPEEVAELELYAWVSQDGIGAVHVEVTETPDGSSPLVFTSRELAETLQEQMSSVATERNRSLYLVRLIIDEVLRDAKPQA
jgi:hypothetical protein